MINMIMEELFEMDLSTVLQTGLANPSILDPAPVPMVELLRIWTKTTQDEMNIMANQLKQDIDDGVVD